MKTGRRHGRHIAKAGSGKRASSIACHLSLCADSELRKHSPTIATFKKQALKRSFERHCFAWRLFRSEGIVETVILAIGASGVEKSDYGKQTEGVIPECHFLISCFASLWATPFSGQSSPTVPQQILETARLILREMSLDDLDFVAAMLADCEVMRYYPKCYTREEAATWIERQMRRYARHGHGLWLAIDKASGEPVGQVGLLMQQIRGVMEKEVAYLIHRPFQRRGFAVEAGAAACDYAFDVFQRRKIFALIRPENIASLGVARKLGLQEEPDRIMHGGFEHLILSKACPAG
jgi:[ribosomal protein S5]-alanine N-acetyltransferase